MSLLETNRQKMAEIAQGILDGGISIIAGALEIHALFCGHIGIDKQDPDPNTFVAIDSETNDLPIGDVRQYWAPDALEHLDDAPRFYSRPIDSKVLDG